MISSFKKIVCNTCGLTFAVTEDFLRSRQWLGRYSLCCPMGHTTQFSNRSMDTPSLLEDMRLRIIQLEKQVNGVVPLTKESIVPSLTAEEIENRLAKQAATRQVLSENARKAERTATGTIAPKKKHHSREKPGMCPYCHKQLARPKEHARSKHQSQYRVTDFQ